MYIYLRIHIWEPTMISGVPRPCPNTTFNANQWCNSSFAPLLSSLTMSPSFIVSPSNTMRPRSLLPSSGKGMLVTKFHGPDASFRTYRCRPTEPSNCGEIPLLTRWAKAMSSLSSSLGTCIWNAGVPRSFVMRLFVLASILLLFVKYSDFPPSTTHAHMKMRRVRSGILILLVLSKAGDTQV